MKDAENIPDFFDRAGLPENSAKAFGLDPRTFVVREFGSWSAYVDRAQMAKPDDLTRSSLRDATGDNAYWFEFYGTESFSDAVTLAANGWADVRPSIDATLGTITSRLEEVVARRVVRRHSVAGGSVKVGRMLSGDPRCMVQTRIAHLPKNGRVVNIAVNGSVDHTVTRERIVKRGAAICALIEALAISGMSTTVTLLQCVRKSGAKSSSVHSVCLKSESSPLDINELMFTIAHPSSLRRITFAVCETEPKTMREKMGWFIGGGYGTPLAFRATGTNGFPKSVLDRFDITVDIPDYRSSRIETDPVGWVADQLTGLGIIRAD